MKIKIKEKINSFITNDTDYPLLVGFTTGFYPLVFYYSNNYESINSIQHFSFFSFLFLIIPTVGTCFLYWIFTHFKKLNPFKKHLLFIISIEVTAIFLSQVYYLTLKKKLLLALLIVTLLLSYKLYASYKKIILFVLILAIIPLVKCLNIILYKEVYDSYKWMKQKDGIETTQFIKKPNIYFIEPDGYIGNDAIIDYPYNYKDTIYKWLESKSFKVYDKTRSNYPASLASNASMFAMKHHFSGRISSNPFEMENARGIIVGNNPVITTLKNNNYKTFFIVEDEYFQQNLKTGQYDFYNIKNSEIPFFSNDNNVKKDVYEDLKKCIENEKTNTKPRFYFVEKLLPHHIHFDGTGKENERKVYLQKIEQTNVWLKKTLALIEKNDPKAIVIIAADHGGWVGIENIEEMFSTKNKKLIKSIFSNLIAIKWNDPKHEEYDEGLKSNVTIFRILFAYLSEKKSLLKNLEDNSSYMIHNENLVSKKAVRVIVE